MSASNEPLLEVTDLATHFITRAGTVKAVDGVSFQVARGEVMGLVGESGSGKSVTGYSILGLVDPPGRIVSGSIRLAGRELVGLDDEAMRSIRGREIAMIFQDPMMTLNPVLRIDTQMIEAILAHERVSERAARDRAVEALQRVGIPSARERLTAYPHQFSGGMRQRVVIALALAAEPRLIVADEPTTALDVSIQAQIIGLIKKLCKEQGTAVMLVTHDMGVIAETADRVAVMYAGRVAEMGPVADVIHRPQHPYTVGLMGSIPSIGEDRDRLAQIDGAMPRLNAIPKGCAFNPRCPKVMPRCREERPELAPAGQSLAACWLHAQTSEAAK
jgi:peptide/nickel transport system ATP-binding protein